MNKLQRAKRMIKRLLRTNNKNDALKFVEALRASRVIDKFEYLEVIEYYNSIK